MFDLRQRKNGRPLLVGHRGAAEAAPENSFPALKAGLAGGADILELDVQLTADKRVVLFHDDNLLDKAGVDGRVGDFTADYLQTLDVGSYFGEAFAGTQIPLLDEVLAWAKGRITLMIELKHGPVFEPELDEYTIRLVEAHNMTDEVVFISFDQFALQRVKRLNPNIAAGFIYSGRMLNPLSVVSGLAVDFMCPGTNWLTPEEVKLIHDAGYACSPGGFWWDYPTLINWGVDTVSSNNPAAVEW